MKRAYVAWAVVLLFPLLLNSAELLNVFKADPVLRFSFLHSSLSPGPVDIHASFDPTIGSVFQPLGRRAADELLHGQLPWWNSDQGIGAPLAGDISSGALYPFILLEALPNGQILLDVFVQIMAGVFTLLLAYRLKLGLLAASVAAVLFEANGTFAWLGAGWCYPLPFLPLLLYGIELTVGPVLRERVLGTVLVALAVGISISAAMIEVAYLDGLLGLVWVLLRIAQTREARRVVRLAVGALLGVMIAMPILIAFADYLRVSYVGVHTGQPGNFGYGLIVLSQVVLPYVLGPVFYHDSGYAGVALSLLGICGVFGRYLRPLRLVLAAWASVAIGASSGVVFFNHLLLAIPGVKYTAYPRYLDGSWEFALALLAALFVYDLSARAGRLWIRYTVATASVLLAVGLGISGEPAFARDALAHPGYATWFWTSVTWAAIAIAVMWITAIHRLTTRRRMLIVAATVIFEASLNYLIPTFGYPRSVVFVDSSVAFLRSHLGLQRFFSFGTLLANYGSYFGIAELNDLELPVATSWGDYMVKHLDRSANPGALLGRNFDQFTQNIDAYESAATKYLVVSRVEIPRYQPAFRAVTDRLSLAYSDAVLLIYELPHPSSYFSAPGCTLLPESREHVTAQCAHPSLLVRRELYLPGWSATIGGSAKMVSETEEVFQALPLPSGSSSVVFSFVPPFMKFGYLAFGIALLALAYQMWEYVRLKRGKPPAEAGIAATQPGILDTLRRGLPAQTSKRPPSGPPARHFDPAFVFAPKDCMPDSTSRSVQQHRMRRRVSEGTLFFWGVIGAIAVKLWLTSGIRIVPIWMPHDEENYVEHARTILTGQWFGTYTNFTLIKSPFYPLYLALVQETGLTLPLANTLLYAAACLIACIAVRPLIRSGVILTGIFAVLFFNPMTYASLAWLTMRSELNDSLALMVTACALAILVRRRATFRTLVKWWVGLGVSFAAFWLTREEAAWLVPCLFVIVLAYFWSIRREPDLQLKLFGLVIPFAIWNLSVATIGKINQHMYGWNTVVEPKAPEFVSAYNSFARIVPVKEEYRISVPRSSREIAYSVSPAARELEPSLEGANGHAWINLVCHYGVHICDDIAGSFFVWAFRDAVAAAGHYSSGSDARLFYLRLASEIDSACDSGKIRCRKKALTIFPNPTWSQVPEIASTFRDAVQYEIAFTQFTLGHVVDVAPSAVLDEQYAFVVRSITYDNRADQGFQGWLATDRPMAITIEDANGVKQVDGYLRQPSADVAAALAQGGHAKWDDQQARFSITTNCRSGCFIVATDSQHHQTRIPLALSTRDFTSPHVIYHLDGVQGGDDVNADNWIKQTILGVIAQAYQVVVPYWVLACAALLVLRGVRAIIRRRVTSPSRQDVLSIAVIAGGGALILILSILTASYSAGLNPEYLGSFTPLMLLALTVATSLEGLIAYRLVRLRLRTPALRATLVRTD